MDTNQWFWMMDYCKRKRLSPADSLVWAEAAREYNKIEYNKKESNDENVDD